MVDLRAWSIPSDSSAFWDSDSAFWNRRTKSDQFLIELASDIRQTRDTAATGYVLFTYESLLRDTGSKSLSSIKERIGF